MTEKPVRVLNVNDRDIPRYVAENLLRQGGFDVISVSSGLDALAAASDGVDVVLLDIQLPDFDGYEICRRLKSNPATESVIVLLTSATMVSAKSKVTGLDSGADGYLVQPYEVAELFATLRSLLRTRAAERRAQALADDLRSAMSVRDEFLAMLGHELRNPLATMTTALHMMEQRRDPESLARYLRVVERQASSLTRIVDDLLDVARITRGKVSLSREVIDLREVAERCAQSQREAFAAAHHRVTVDLDPDPVLVIGDAVRLEQIACNLVTNSIKYTPSGGVVAITVSRTGDRARLEVSDTGIGMDEAMRARVFDVFVQGKQTIDRSRGGLGLGLAVVKQLVELHGGTVAAFSAGDGKGSRFAVDLPLAPATAIATPHDDLHVMPPCAGVRIVVIEDNEEARETLRDALVELRHQVAAASDGMSGLELVVNTKPDVALVDIGLPRLDGYEVARQVRIRCNGSAPRLIAMTGYGQPEDRARAEAAGFDHHLVKPVSLDRLQRLLATVSSRKA
ncbi:MAG: response regulator [Kofleriaceae bacterium]